MPSFLVRFFAGPYVSGNSIEQGIEMADKLWRELGISSTLDLLGESVTSREDVENNFKVYVELIHQLEGKEYTTVSIKPSALGSHDSYDYCIEQTRKLLDVAKKSGTVITIDMEDHTLTDFTLKMYRELLPEYSDLGTVLQSRLFRTKDDINSILNLQTRIRTCIGIYNEDESIALTNKDEMKEELISMAQKLLRNGHQVEFATHDLRYLDRMLKWAKEEEIPPNKLEFQQLMGVPLRKMQKRILDAGYAVRLYVPFTLSWNSAIPYLKRRMKNNPRMISYVLRNIFIRN